MATDVMTSFDAQLSEFRHRVMKLMPKVKAAVPSHVQPNQLVRTLFAAIESNPAILTKCTQESLGRCLIQAATYGLEINSGQLGHAYVVPYGDQAQLQLSYKGIKELVRRSGEGIVVMGEIREGDDFHPPTSKMQDVHHVEAADPKRHEKTLTHAYAVMHFTTGLKVNCVWSREKCISHRDRYSKGYKQQKAKKKERESAWHEEHPSFGKMCAKTCVHALANDGDLPLSAEVRALLRDKDAGSEVIEPAPLQTAPQQSLPEQPPDIDWAWFDKQLNKTMTEKALDDLRDELIELHTHQKQEIWDRCEEHRDQLREPKS
jgi:phage RecT family recombinase